MSASRAESQEQENRNDNGHLTGPRHEIKNIDFINTDIKVLTILKYAKMLQVPRQGYLNKVSCLQVFALRNVIFF